VKSTATVTRSLYYFIAT